VNGVPPPKKSRVMIIAGEASSSLYAQRLLEYWRDQGRQIEAFGIGSRSMEALGFQCIGRSEELAVVGLAEVLRHFPLIRRTYHALLAECDRDRPDFVLLLDYPDFNLRLAGDLKKRGIKVIYYISPQVWAWRQSRVKHIRKVVDRMLVLFPFEVDFYRGHNVDARFVGHPLLDELSQFPWSPEKLRLERERCGLGRSESGELKVLGLMPGSRESELRHHLRAQIQAAELFIAAHPEWRVALLCAPTIERERLAQEIASARIPIQILKQEPFAMISLCDSVLVASGTATLMVGLMQKPMVIMYRMNPLTAWLAKRLVRSTRFFGMSNLILNDMVSVELFQDEANPKRMAGELSRLVSPQAYQHQSQQLGEIQKRLGSKGATQRVAAELEEFFRKS